MHAASRQLLALVALAVALRDQGARAERLSDDEPDLSSPLLSRVKDSGKQHGALQLEAHDAEDLEPVPPDVAETIQSPEEKTAKAVMGFFYSPNLVYFWRVAVLTYAIYVGVCISVSKFLLRDAINANPEMPTEGQEKNTEGFFDSDLIGFHPRSLEVRWLQESYREVISIAAKVLAFAAFGYIIYRCVRFERRSQEGSCLPVYWPLAWAEIITLAVMMGLSLYCASKPSGLYWVILGFFFFYILASALPPFAFSCTQLVNQCQNTKDRFTEQASRHADCSLEGYTAQQTIMTWIMVQPWVIPRVSLMPLAWMWLLGVYFLWTVAYRTYIRTAAETFQYSAVLFHFVLLNFTFGISCLEKAQMERMQRWSFLAELRMKDASRKLFTMLRHMVPVHVTLPMIQRPGEVIAEQVDRVSILFVVIDDFDEVADKLSPAEVLRFLNEYFTKFDDICEANRVTKIETVGEEYVACVGVMPEDIEENKREGHSKILNRLIIAADQILKLQSDTVRFKMGLHSGPIVAGVIGSRLPRYRLFGDTINTAARLMQKGEVGQLQFGEETHKDLPEGVETRLRGHIELKGKGEFKAYLCEKVRDSDRMAPTLRPKRTSIFGAMADKEGQGDGDAGATYSYTAAMVASSAKAKKSLFGQDDDMNTADIQLTGERDEAFENVLAGTKDDADTYLVGPQYKAWLRWHHQIKVLGKVTGSLDMQLAVLTVLTVIEGAYMHAYKETERSNGNIPAAARLPIFLVCRGVVLTIMIVWRSILNSTSDWVKESGELLMYARLVSWVFLAIVLFISYDDLTPDDVAEIKEGKVLVEIAPFSQNFSLVFVLVYMIVTRMEGMLAKQVLVFIPVSAGLMVYAEIHENENVVHSIPAKVFFMVNTLLNCAVNYLDETTSKKQFKAKLSVESTQTRMDGILSTLMPPLVFEELRCLPPDASQPTHTYKLATICQSDLCGFTALSSTRTPREVVQFMGELFGSFDELTDTFGVYKVETVGDAYIAGMAEAPLTPTNSPVNVVLFGLAMIDAVHKWARNLGENVTCRVGVHYGECIGGIVGIGMKRYHLFGKLLCGMEVLESTAPEGKVQISPACKAALEKQAAPEVKQLLFKQREEPHLQTSKGHIHEYESVGGRTFVVTRVG